MVLLCSPVAQLGAHCLCADPVLLGRCADPLLFDCPGQQDRLVKMEVLQTDSRKKFAPMQRCLQIRGDSTLHPCMLVISSGRRSLITSFQVSAGLQRNVRLIASDQGATSESENSIISLAIISASSDDFLGDWWRQMLEKLEPGKKIWMPPRLRWPKSQNERGTHTYIISH